VKLRLLILIALAALVAAPGADGAWKRLTPADGANIDQVALLRTADGVLHAAWTHRTGPNTQDLLHTAISPNGTIGATTPIQTGWAVLENPALVAVPGGIRVFFGGIRTTDPSETNLDLNTAFSATGGMSWVLQIGSVIPPGTAAYASPVSATVLPSGVPLEAWAGSLGTWVHAGLTPVTANHNFQGPLGNYGYDPAIAANGAGQAYMAWYSNATSHLGVYAQGVAADGSPSGPLLQMPFTAAMNVGMIGRTPLVVRSNGAFYVAYVTGYPSLNRVRLWRIGGATRLIAKLNAFGSGTATVAADSNGRLWVAWTRTISGSPHVYVRRSNKAATVFGAVVDAGRPTNAFSTYRLDASATAKALDLFSQTGIGPSPFTATWKTRVLPGLTLSASPQRLQLGRRTAVTFTVRDAGDPVKGAKVSAGGKSGHTNANGRVTLTLLGQGRTVKATATAPGYVKATLSLRVRR
jgi:hypothetical protein